MEQPKSVDIVKSKSRTRALIAILLKVGYSTCATEKQTRSHERAYRRPSERLVTREPQDLQSRSLAMLISSGYARVTDEHVAASAAAASARHHDLTPAGLAAAACSAAAAAVEVTAAQIHTLAQKEGLVLVKARNETGFEGVRFRPSACALLSKPFKARYNWP